MYIYILGCSVSIQNVNRLMFKCFDYSLQGTKESFMQEETSSDYFDRPSARSSVRNDSKLAECISLTE